MYLSLIELLTLSSVFNLEIFYGSKKVAIKLKSLVFQKKNALKVSLMTS